MRVATRARTQTRRARWGGRLLGAGLTTVVALGVAVSPASARQLDPGAPSSPGNVQPEEVGNGTFCPDGTDITFSLLSPIPTGHNEFEILDVGHIAVDVTSTTQTFNFSITGPLAARQIIVHSTPSANRYSYDAGTGFPNGRAQDGLLHAPSAEAGGAFNNLTSIVFCLINSPYNGHGTGTA
ncbi:hypothetical protein [Streptomyces sp. NPDC046805]|uniref:hypothetical protein n=1 Tax=Streptomyces sp. NPDC046805 TaxID=3155134 RepID=UPI00340A2384